MTLAALQLCSKHTLLSSMGIQKGSESTWYLSWEFDEAEAHRGVSSVILG